MNTSTKFSPEVRERAVRMVQEQAFLDFYDLGERGDRALPGVKFVIYDTSDPDRPNGRKIVIAEERYAE